MSEKQGQIWYSVLLVVVSGFVFFSLGVTLAWKWGFPNHFAEVEYPVYYESKSTTATTAFAGVVDLNVATVEDLMQIRGIGEKTAQNIVTYRELIGGYTFLEQLLDVDGVGQKKLEDWKAYLAIDTAASTVTSVSTTTTSVAATATTAFSGVLNLNTATIDELMLINGIGEVTATKIVEYRDEIGGFTSLEQLLDIEGIGEKKLAAWRRYFTLEN